MVKEDWEILHGDIGEAKAHKGVVLRSKCPFCNDKVTFRQLEYDLKPSKIIGKSVALQCEGCHSICTFSLERKKFYPLSKLEGLEGLPPEIDKYYKEALRCLESDSPNGAVTMFRKIIHALGIHYGIAQKGDNKSLYGIIKELYGEGEKEGKGHIVEKLRNAMLNVKDIGNDGAHINENEPDMDQATKIWKLIDTVLSSTVIADASLKFLEGKHNTKEL